ncbi:collagenase [Kitasatospora indigofera]|uniref:collagenase n=1 Tax=Kitasatospora indigofera TaxID=67307 RepID=UPI00364F40BE
MSKSDISFRRTLVQAAVSLLAMCAATAVLAVPASAVTGTTTVAGTSGPAGPAGAQAPTGSAPHPGAPGAVPLPARAGVAGPVATQAADATLPVNHTCSSTLRIRAQRMTAQDLKNTCDSLAGQDTYFHSVVKDSGQPVRDDRNTSLEVVVFDSRAEYVRLAGSLYGVSTDNGGVYLEGNPAAAGNQARFVAYRDENAQTFAVVNLNHEYTHYLDGRYDMYGDWNANVSTPTLWWIEGLAEYVSYGYRGVFNSWAAGEASRQTYALSTLFDTTQQNDQNRIYAWGYLAVYYLVENHPADVAKILGLYRAGSWQTARSYVKQTIGTRYDADFRRWLLT